MDKNPRQITRLRYLDARNLEKFVNSLTYESDTNTFEIGTKLYVDGKFEVNDDAIFRGNLDAYNDSALTFYQGDNAQTPYMSMSPLFATTTLSFLYSDGQAINTSIDLDVSVDAQILTDKNVKTFFGNKSIVKDPTKPNENNIDLYNHIISIDINSTILLNIFVKASSSNLKVDSLNDLTTLLNAKEDTIIDCIAYNEGQSFTRNVNITGLIYTNLTWKYGLVYMTPQGPFIDNGVLITTATINDVVTTI